MTLSYNDFHMQYFDSEFIPDREVFCIDHCREGRLEYAARSNAYSYVEAGDLKLDRWLDHTAHFIGEIKNIMVDKVEDIEPPLAHIDNDMFVILCYDLR